MIKFKQNAKGVSIDVPLKLKDSVIEKITETSSFDFVSLEKVRKRCIISLEQAQDFSVTIEELEGKLKEVYSN